MGEINFPSENDTFSNATLTVTIQDTSEADAPARILAKQICGNISRPHGSREPLPFVLECEDIRESPFVTLTVLVDLDGDGRISSGDYISMESYPVHFSPHKMQIQVRRVA